MRPTASRVVNRHTRLRDQGVYQDPALELYAVHKLIDKGDLTPSERVWAYRRQKVLYERIQTPSARFKVLGVRSGRLPSDLPTETIRALRFHKAVQDLYSLLDKN